MIFGRDLWILLLAAIALQFTSFRKLEPSGWGKASTFLQVMTAVAIMAARGYHDPVLGRMSEAMIWGVAALAFISGADYSLRGVFWLRER